MTESRAVELPAIRMVSVAGNERTGATATIVAAIMPPFRSCTLQPKQLCSFISASSLANAGQRMTKPQVGLARWAQR